VERVRKLSQIFKLNPTLEPGLTNIKSTDYREEGEGY